MSALEVSFDRTGLQRGKVVPITLLITNSGDRDTRRGDAKISTPPGIIADPATFELTRIQAGQTLRLPTTFNTWAYLDYGNYPVTVTTLGIEIVTPFQVQLPAYLRLPDIAIGKAATQSSAGFAPASLAVDGNTDGNFFDGSVSHTGQDVNAWWQVDLGQSYNIEEIDIWNRTDGSSSRLTDYYVLVSEQPLPVSLPDALATAGAWVSHQPTQAQSPTAIEVGATGRYVRVQLAGTNYLHMAEVQVFETT